MRRTGASPLTGLPSKLGGGKKFLKSVRRQYPEEILKKAAAAKEENKVLD